MCDYCESGKNLFLQRYTFPNYKYDKTQIIINPKKRIIEIKSQDTFSPYEKPVRTVRMIKINFCPMCGRELSEV